MNKEDCVPVLRAPLDSNSTRTIADGTRAEISSDNYGSERTSVEKTTIASDGTKYLQMPMPETYLSSDSNAIRRFMQDGGVDVKITYRAPQPCLRPAASALTANRTMCTSSSIPAAASSPRTR